MPDIRILYRYETLTEELNMLEAGGPVINATTFNPDSSSSPAPSPDRVPYSYNRVVIVAPSQCID